MDRGLSIFLGFAALVIGYQAIKGWRLGFVRQIVRFGALAAAYATALFASGFAVPFLKPLGYPDPVLYCIGGFGIGLLAYLAVSFLGGVLFKRTAHQNMGLVWFFYGVTGALMGIAFGLVVVLVVADAVRFLGGIAEARTALKPPVAKQGRAATTGAKKAKPENPIPDLLVEVKKGMEGNLIGEVLQTVDPVPKKFYGIAGKLGRAVSSPEAAGRFFSYPGAMDLAAQPEIQALRNDPEIVRALRDGQYMALLKNPKILKAANSPETAALLKKFDLEKALDYALKK
ncbi:MAG: hypothetical protein NTZ46_04470 [Verrucomicrobia bacterium]|nr:hypothetical protein [Verrucomicrobiota bacterium]